MLLKACTHFSMDYFIFYYELCCNCNFFFRGKGRENNNKEENVLKQTIQKHSAKTRDGTLSKGGAPLALVSCPLSTLKGLPSGTECL